MVRYIAYSYVHHIAYMLYYIKKNITQYNFNHPSIYAIQNINPNKSILSSDSIYAITKIISVIPVH